MHLTPIQLEIIARQRAAELLLEVEELRRARMLKGDRRLARFLIACGRWLEMAGLRMLSQDANGAVGGV